MKTRSLLKLALVIAVLGTLILLILSQNIEPKIIKISSINEKRLDEWVRVSGSVIDKQSYSSLNIITLEDETASINCILQQNENPDINSTIVVTGKVTEYKGQLEIEVSYLR